MDKMDSIFANRPLSLRAVALSRCPERSRRVVEGGVERLEPQNRKSKLNLNDATPKISLTNRT
jgi:hypothetical protein